MRDYSMPRGGTPTLEARPPLPPLSEIIEYAMPWAEQHSRTAFDATKRVLHSEAITRSYLARIIELMWDSFTPEQRRFMPMSMLQVSTIRSTVERAAHRFEVCGQYAKGKHRWEFYELATIAPDEFDSLHAMKLTLDLYHYPVIIK